MESALLKEIAEAAGVPPESVARIRRQLEMHGLSSLSLAFDEDHPVWNHIVEHGVVRVPSAAEHSLLEELKPWLSSIRRESFARGLKWGLLKI